MRRLLLALVPLLAAAGEECALVEQDRILAGDLARLRPLFRGLDPSLALAFAPAPGLHRVLTADDLRRLARRHGLPEVSLESVCFERSAEELTESRLLEVLRGALAEPAANIEILDFSRYPVPKGELVFPLTGLAAPPPARPDVPVLWRGAVRYDGRRSSPVWARVRITVARRQLVARRDLPAGRPIGAEDLEERVVETFPGATEKLASAAGAIPRRRIRAGEAIDAAWLKLPLEVERGETVTVEVASGAARLLLEARAETGGRRGQAILVRNPSSGQRFTATIDGRGRVSLQLEKGERIP